MRFLRETARKLLFMLVIAADPPFGLPFDGIPAQNRYLWW
jgi:hypothetical protein